jgi:DNA integrity scanning protein DisA with diadenylate cyclase activity
MEIQEAVANSAVALARDIGADALLVLTENGESFEKVIGVNPEIPVIGATANEETFQDLMRKVTLAVVDVDFIEEEEKDVLPRDLHAIRLMMREISRISQIEDAVIIAMDKGIVKDRDTLVVVGSTLATEVDSIFVYLVKKERLDMRLHHFMREINVKQEVFESVLNLALEIGREGREGRLIGTAFLIGDTEAVQKRSKQLILNPFEGHDIKDRMILDRRLVETIKELAQLDGAFLIYENGVIVAAGSYLNVDTTKVDIPKGLGTRHAAVAAMTKVTKAIGITVSKSGGIVRIFKEGEVVLTIEPQRKIALRTEVMR